MDIRDSFSRLKKKLKNRHKPRRTGVGPGGGSTNSLPLSKPYIVDRDREEIHSTDRPPQPDELEPLPAYGSANCQGKGEEGGVSQDHSRPRPNIEVEAGSGRGREGNDDSGKKVGGVYPSPSTPSILRDGEPDGM